MNEVVTVDSLFLAQTLTIAMQMRQEIGDDEYVEVKDMQIDQETGYLQLLIEKHRMTYN